MPSKNKRKASQIENTPTQQQQQQQQQKRQQSNTTQNKHHHHHHHHHHQIQSNNNDEFLTFQGDRLFTLVHSFQRVIESERQSNKALPDKLWFKMQFAVGINEVTRLLERMNPSTNAAFANPLQAVLVASDCNPKWLTKHLPSLASSRKVPLIYVKDNKEGSLRLGELAKVKTAIAIGVKAKGSNINQFVQRVLHPDESDITGTIQSKEAI